MPEGFIDTDVLVYQFDKRNPAKREAIDTSLQNDICFWDALIVAAAEAARCKYLYTEDLNDGQIILNVRVQNPAT